MQKSGGGRRLNGKISLSDLMTEEALKNKVRFSMDGIP